MTQPAQKQRSSAYRTALGALRELARLAEQGRSQTSDAIPFRATLDSKWGELSFEEQELIEGMSADLWTLMDVAPLGPVPPASTQEAFKTAVETQSWLRVSNLLRDFPRLATGFEGALRRAECWAALGEHAIAAEFAEHASRLLRSTQLNQVQPVIRKRRDELQKKSGANRIAGSVPFLGGSL